MEHDAEIRDIFQRYAAEVGRRIPLRGREDIQREILATLEDRLDDRLEESGRAATMEDAVALLRETGHPRKTAASYAGNAFLIGPALYPVFTVLCRVVLPIVGVSLIAAGILAAALGGDGAKGFIAHAVGILGSSVSTVLQTFAVIVAIFALIERFTPKEELAAGLSALDSWNPRTLPPADKGLKVDVAEQVAVIAFCAVWIIALVFYADIVRAMDVVSRGLALTVSEKLRGMVPLLIASAGLEVLVAAFTLARGRVTGVTVAARVASKILGIAVCCIVLTAWPFVGVSEAAPDGAAFGIRVLNYALIGGLLIAIAADAADSVKQTVRWLRSRRGA